MPTAPLYAQNTADRGLMASLWQNSLPGYVSNDPAFGVRFTEDFKDDFAANSTVNSVVNGWYMDDVGSLAAASVSKVAANPDGHLLLSGTPDGASEGVYIKRGAAAATGEAITLPSHATLARGRVVYQTRLPARSHTSVRVYFAGLQLNTATVSPLAAGGAMADEAHIGFRIDASGNLTFTCKSLTSTGVADSVQVLAAANVPSGALNLGFAVNKNLTVDIVVNGVWYKAAAGTIAKAALPTVALARVYAIDNAAATTVAGTLTIDDSHVFIAP